MRIKLLLIIASLFSAFFIACGQNVEFFATKFLEQYKEYSTFVEGDSAYTIKTIDKFEQLFLGNKLTIYNDIVDNLGFKKSYLTVDQYVANMRKYYPKGITSIDFIKYKYRFPSSEKENVKTIYAEVTKRTIGLYKNKTFAERTNVLNYQLQYLFNGDTAVFKIAGIENPFKYRNTRLNILPHFNLLFSSIKFKGNNSNHYNEIGNIESKYGLGYGIGVNVSYLITKNLGIGAGVTWTVLWSEISIDYFKQMPITSIDIDNDKYINYFQAQEVNEVIKINSLRVPFSLIYSPRNYNGIGRSVLNHMYGKLGLYINYALKATSNLKFRANNEGYYSKYNVLLYDIAEYGFVERKESHRVNVIINNLSFSPFIALGASYPFFLSKGYFVLNFEVGYSKGITNLNSSSKDEYLMLDNDSGYRSLVGITEEVFIDEFGINLGIIFPL